MCGFIVDFDAVEHRFIVEVRHCLLYTLQTRPDSMFRFPQSTLPLDRNQSNHLFFLRKTAKSSKLPAVEREANCMNLLSSYFCSINDFSCSSSSSSFSNKAKAHGSGCVNGDSHTHHIEGSLPNIQDTIDSTIDIPVIVDPSSLLDEVKQGPTKRPQKFGKGDN